MENIDIPDRVTNKELYKVLIKIEHRLTRVETCIEGQKKDIDHLKKRDWWNGGVSVVLAALAGYIGINK